MSEASIESLHQLNQISKLKQQEDNVKGIRKFQPYSYSDYIKMRDNYDKHYKKLGGLGPNLGSPDWMEKRDKYRKMNDYVSQLKTTAESPQNNTELFTGVAIAGRLQS